MKAWDQRPIEYRNLFNPAFCGLALNRAFQGYEELNDDGMPFSLSLLVLPLCLHEETRNVIGENSRARLLKTVEGNQQLLVGFAVRAKNLLPYTLEALGLLTHLGCLKVGLSGRLKTVPRTVRAKYQGRLRQWNASVSPAWSARSSRGSLTASPYTRRSEFVHEDRVDPSLQP